ncbi:hypothetical protein LEMLEM_LOCUS1712 [Lemmus lemmus]
MAMPQSQTPTFMQLAPRKKRQARTGCSLTTWDST